MCAANGKAEGGGVARLTNNNVEPEMNLMREGSVASPACSPEQLPPLPCATPLQSTPLHPSQHPASPFRLLREESVDGTLSPVSMKGGMDTLDNDTTGRRKVSRTDSRPSPGHLCPSQ